MKRNFERFNKRIITEKALFIFVLILIVTCFALGIAPKGTKIKALQFDCVMELNSVKMKTHVMLFVRYLVSPDSYRASIIWAEPHISGLNYPIYPPTTIIDSNRTSLRISNEVKSQYNETYAKPLGKRDVFRYMFNDYPISNIRFAETEGLSSRVFAKDLAQLSEPDETGWQTAHIAEPTDANNLTRELARLDIKAESGHINSMKLLDAKDRLIKSIGYEYSTENGLPFLKKQNIQLAERPFMVGYQSGGIRLTVNGRQQLIKQILTVQHAGSRKCNVDYETKKIGDKSVSLPVNIAVYSGDGKNKLRSSRLMNFKQVELNGENTDKSIQDCASFDISEKVVREMLVKYWMENPEEVAEDDSAKMRELQKHFEKVNTGDFAGDQLRRINMLLQLDWILGDKEQLPKHYQQYLNILKSNGLEQMLITGGQQAIETTFRWKQFSSADELLKMWIETVYSFNKPDDILNFAQAAIEKQRFWETANLLEQSLVSPEKFGSKQIDAQFLNCTALYGLYQMLQEPDKIPEGRKKEQANWVLSEMTMGDLLQKLKQNVKETQKSVSSIKNPDNETKAVQKQLEEMSQKIIETGQTKENPQ